MDNMKEYRTGLRKIHRMIVKGTDESEEGDRIRDEMDDPWNRMTPEQREEMSSFSAKLYVIQDLKEFIKKLAVSQKKDRFFRKKRVQEANREAWEAHCKEEHDGMHEYSRSVKITAALNWYHVLRGTPYRHQIERVSPYEYDKAEKEVREKFCLKEKMEPAQI